MAIVVDVVETPGVDDHAPGVSGGSPRPARPDSSTAPPQHTRASGYQWTVR